MYTYQYVSGVRGSWGGVSTYNIYIYQLQLFGSKVILAATHEQALLFP